MIGLINRPPVFIHNCSGCEYLGGLDDGARHYDCYRCGDTVIVRYSSEPMDEYTRPVEEADWRRSQSMYTLWLMAVRNGGTFPFTKAGVITT
jgi:hypothetical protein